jgi:acetyl esterase
LARLALRRQAAGAAPAFVAIAGHELAIAQGEARAARRLQEDGVLVVLKRWPAGVHGFISMGRYGPAAAAVAARG